MFYRDVYFIHLAYWLILFFPFIVPHATFDTGQHEQTEVSTKEGLRGKQVNQRLTSVGGEDASCSGRDGITTWTTGC